MQKQRVEFWKSITFKISIAVVAVEIMALSTISLVYYNQFTAKIDQQLRSRIAVPGKLLAEKFLRQDIVKQQDIMESMVGSGLADSKLVSISQSVQHALNPEDENKRID